MTKQLISRMTGVQSPIIPAVGQLMADYPGTISLGQGVVSYGPPQKAIARLSQFLAAPENHKYQSACGIPPLLEVIAAKLERENKIKIDAHKSIVVTAGSNMAFVNAILAITSPGDEVILLAPYYFNHEMAITMADCKPVVAQTDENYQLDISAIAAAITPRTKAVVTISPNNPTGVVYSQSALRQVNQICEERGIYHLSDEAYEYFTYNGAEHFSPGAISSGDKQTISLYSLSKAYGFASWRIGYMVVPAHLLEAVKKVQDTILICPPVISQYGALGALEVGVSYSKQHLQQINEVGQLMKQQLLALDNVSIGNADGAFYFFLKVDRSMKAMELVEKLIREYGVAVIPGDTFGMENGCYLRVSYGALELETAVVGIERLVRGLESIKNVTK